MNLGNLLLQYSCFPSKEKNKMLPELGVFQRKCDDSIIAEQFLDILVQMLINKNTPR